jgi:hypothetical protein
MPTPIGELASIQRAWVTNRIRIGTFGAGRSELSDRGIESTVPGFVCLELGIELTNQNSGSALP